MKKKRLYIILLLLVIVLLPILYFFFIKSNKMSEEKFVSFYTDMVIAQDSLGTSTAATKKIRENLYKKYDINEEMYRQTIDFYNKDPQKWEEFFDKVIKNLESIKRAQQRI
jgi:hypothetical protein